MKKLIINADDFALHPAINEAIINAHIQGVLTSTSILATGDYFQAAVSLASYYPKLSIGAHLCLVGGLKPITNPQLIPSLLDPKTKRFYDNYLIFTKKFFLKQIKLSEIELELSNQINFMRAHGLILTHIDSHQHLHVLPGINDVVVKIAQKNQITKIRLPHENFFFTGNYPYTFARFLGRTILSIFAKLSKKKFEAAQLTLPNSFFGMLAGGNLQEKYFLNILENITTETNEIMIHPGNNNKDLTRKFAWQYNWELELQTLLSSQVKEKLKEKNIALISFKDL